MEFLILLIVLIVIVATGFAVIGFVFSLLWYLLIGLIIGALARLVLPGSREMGLTLTALYGVAGSVLGGIIGHAAHGGSLLRLLLSVLVSAVLIALTSARSHTDRV